MAFLDAASLLALAALFPVALPALAAERTVSEHELKAAFLYNFALFAEWPREAFADAASPIAVCVFGDHAILGALQDSVQGKVVSGRGFAIHRIAAEAEARRCHIVFFSDSERKRKAAVLATLGGSHVLMVGESDDFLELGGIINLKLQDARIRIEINLEAAARSKCRLSSKLIRLADGAKR